MSQQASESDPDRSTDEYKKASLTVSLSACIALADGHASEEEAGAVEARISSWQHLHADLYLFRETGLRFGGSFDGPAELGLKAPQVDDGGLKFTRPSWQVREAVINGASAFP